MTAKPTWRTMSTSRARLTTFCDALFMQRRAGVQRRCDFLFTNRLRQRFTCTNESREGLWSAAPSPDHPTMKAQSVRTVAQIPQAPWGRSISLKMPAAGTHALRASKPKAILPRSSLPLFSIGSWITPGASKETPSTRR